MAAPRPGTATPAPRNDHPADFVPPPVQILLPQGEVTGLLWERRQLPGGWFYLVSFDLWVCDEDGVMSTASARMWVDAPGRARPIEGVDPAAYAAVPVYPLPLPDSKERQLGPGGLPAGSWNHCVVAAPTMPSSTQSTAPMPRPADRL